MEHHTTTSRAEAERLLGISEKLLRNKDFSGSKDFAILAQETEPLLEGPDQILAVADVLLAADKRVSNHNDWYSILQVPQRTDDMELIKKQYRRLALLLHPDKNRFAFSESAFGLVADAWAVLSDPGKKPLYDNEFSLFTKVDLVAMKKQATQRPQGQQFHQQKKPDEGIFHQKLSVRRSAAGGGGGGSGSGPGTRSNNRKGMNNSNTDNSGGLGSDGSGTYWTACPYCYNLYEYPRVYDGCCFRCQNCKRAFTGTEILSMPPMVPGKEAYYCCWGFFPMGFVMGNSEGKKSRGGNGYPNWMPPMFGSGGVQVDGGAPLDNGAAVPTMGGSVPLPPKRNTNVTRTAPVASSGAKKRGRPRKNV
ncbi:Chaperone DnaJ-domain superfamily protein [Forsythia ovata]|uniref:Chaperone DnaJ-domain superfamily protein n=1 Tax=Forsythia ovata TaxID=205694 RepID=A0ABD1RKX1_9LAMI